MDSQTEISGQLILKEYGYAWDGGSIYLEGIDEQEESIEICLVQRAFFEHIDPLRIQGRLYLNNQLISPRSEEEFMVLQKMKDAKVVADFINPNENKQKKSLSGFWKKLFNPPEEIETYGNDMIKAHLDEVVAFVESDEYLELIEKLNIQLDTETKPNKK